MRIRAFALLPAALLATSGVGIAYMAWHAPRSVPGLVESTSIRHYVTPKMEKDSRALARKPAPQVHLKSYDGRPVELGVPTAHPTFVVFVKEGCPCSFDAEPLFHDLYRRYAGKIDFVSVTDASEKGAKKWSTEMSVPYPVVSDPQAATMKLFGAKASVYNALLDTDGRIIKLWPGYSKGFLKEMNHEMATSAGVAETPFDTKYAPIEKATGCAFGFDVG